MILVVEDDPLIHAIVEEALSEGGFEVVIASAGENAVDLLGASDGKYRALVTDINLGKDGITGWDVARRAREINPSFPVVYMSGDSAEDWASHGRSGTASCCQSLSRRRSSSPRCRSF